MGARIGAARSRLSPDRATPRLHDLKKIARRVSIGPPAGRRLITMTTLAITPVAVPATRSIARHAATAARILLGLVFFVFGLDGFLHFIPQPTAPMSENAMAFAIGLVKSGYMFPLIKGTEVAVGLALLSNRLVALALIVIAPVIVNIVAFHAFLAPSGLAIACALVVLAGYLAWVNRRAYAPLFARR
jgi:uncharacterized membrane protein YphA (DoxX/SURF4 family)